MGISRYNSEGYSDPTSHAALSGIRREKKAVKRAYRPLVYICSPFAGDTEKNTQKARRYSRFAVKNGAIPFAPHLLFPQFLDDGKPAERAIGMFLFGMNGEYLPLREGMTEDFYYGIFMACVAAAVGILVYSGLEKDEYDVEKYNKSNASDAESRKKNNRISVWCGCIMLVATMLFLVAGLVFNLWEICWIVFVIGGLLCGIVTIILNREK